MVNALLCTCFPFMFPSSSPLTASCGFPTAPCAVLPQVACVRYREWVGPGSLLSPHRGLHLEGFFFSALACHLPVICRGRVVGGGGPEPWSLQPWVLRPDSPTAPVAFCGIPLPAWQLLWRINSPAAWLKVAGHCLGGSEALFRIPPLIPIEVQFQHFGVDRWSGEPASVHCHRHPTAVLGTQRWLS